MMQNIEIKLLKDCKEYIPTLAKLWYEQISKHWVPNASIERAKENLLKHANKDRVPLAFVASHKNEPIGMACLRETDGIRPGVAPWLGSLVVNPKYRGQQIGETLINAVKEQAKKLGHRILYLLAFDPTIPHWYERLGWQRIGDDELFNHRVTMRDWKQAFPIKNNKYQ